MRRTLSCVLMMTLLLTACGGSGEESPENLAARIRAEYLSLSGWSAEVFMTADYGDRVYEFTVDATWAREGDTVLTITAPELVAGITARLSDGVGYLEYEGASLSTGPIGDGMNPLEAVPFVMEQVTAGYMARCSFVEEGEQKLLRVLCREAEGNEGTGGECTLYFDVDSHDLVRAELSWDGVTVLTARLNEFTKEMSDGERADHANLGGNQPGQSGT